MTADIKQLVPDVSPKAASVRPQATVFPGAVLLLYILLGACVAFRHEPWADEAHSWLLSRDAGLLHLWTTLLHYEGTPGLWQTILHVLIRLGTPYSAFNFISMAAGSVAAWLLITYAPFPILVRVLLPFTYYLFFQYAVVARSYALLPVLTFSCAILYLNARRRPGLFTLMTCLLAAISLDGFLLGVVIYSRFLLETRGEHRRSGTRWSRKTLTLTAVFLVVSLVLAWSAWPARDNQFVTHFNLSFQRLLTLTPAMFRYAFTGEWLTMTAIIAFSIPFLLRTRTLFTFLAATLCLCVAHSLIYVDVWHIGAVFLAWLFCMWIAAARAPVTPLVTWAFLLVIAFQGYWAFQSGRYDWNHPYSGSRDAALFLKSHPEITGKGLYLAGYSTEAVRPYFSLGELNRFTYQNKPAYWDWSAREIGEDPRPLLTTNRFGYLLAGYKLPAESARWANVAGIAGFRFVKHFEGNLFWRTLILEKESFDLYERIGPPPVTELSNSIDMGNPLTARQLLSGLHSPEANAWRWTEKSFSIALRRPDGAEVNGARLTLRLFIPDNQIRDLGPITLRGEINGLELGSDHYNKAGDVVFVHDVPAEYLSSAVPVFTFTFDKARAPSGNEDRQLSAIAKSVSIEKK